MRARSLILVCALLFLAAGCGTGTGGPLITFPPTLTGVSPPSGPNGGGTLLTLTGTNFTALMTVTVGGIPCLGVSVDPLGTSLTCTTVGGTAGPKDVRVETVTGSATLVGAFTYTIVLSPKARPRVDLAVLDGDGLPLALLPDVLTARAHDDLWYPGAPAARDDAAGIEPVEAGGHHFVLVPALGVIAWYRDAASALLGDAPEGCLFDERLRSGQTLLAVAR